MIDIMLSLATSMGNNAVVITTRTTSIYHCISNLGKVKLDVLVEPPEPLKSLLNGTHTKSVHFLNNIRQYNSAFAFTSFGVTGNAGQRNPSARFMSVQVHGELYHLQGPLNINHSNPRYNQLYIYDPTFASSIRTSNNAELDPELTKDLSIMLHENSGNPFVRIYKHAHEILKSESDRQREEGSENFHVRLNPQMKMELVVGIDKRTQNLPTADEVAGIIPNEYLEESFRDIIITFRKNINDNTENIAALYKRIDENHAAYMPLHYVLLFPRGEYGWHWGLRLDGSDDNEQERSVTSRNEGEDDNKRLTQRAFYRHRLHIQEGETNTIFLAKRLFQQYLVDSWAVCKQSKLG